MTNLHLQRLDRSGTMVVPAESDYDDRSAHWSETEFRANLVSTDSVAGFWEGTVGWVAINSWPYNEVCVILRGRVAVEDATGHLDEFGPGQAFLVPVGFRGVWHTLETTEKIFVGVVPEHG